MHLSWLRLTEKRHSFFLRRRNHDILVAMDFLLATVVQRLFLSLFWSLTTSFGAVNDGIDRILTILLLLLEFLWVAFWRIPKIIQCLF